MKKAQYEITIHAPLTQEELAEVNALTKEEHAKEEEGMNSFIEDEFGLQAGSVKDVKFSVVDVEADDEGGIE